MNDLVSKHTRFREVVKVSTTTKDSIQIPEINLLHLVEYFMKHLTEDYSGTFSEELKQIESGDFHDTASLLRVQPHQIRTCGGQLTFPESHLPWLFQSLIEKINKKNLVNFKNYELKQSVKFENNLIGLKTFTCDIQQAKEQSEQIFYVLVKRNLDNTIVLIGHYTPLT